MNVSSRPSLKELPKIDTRTDTRDYLAHAKRQAENLSDYLIVDIDAHVGTETMFWSEITDRMDNEVYKSIAKSFEIRGSAGLLNGEPGMLVQDVGGRIPHQTKQGEDVPSDAVHRQVVLTQRAMDSMGIDYMVVFPTPMLMLGMHPQSEVEVQLGTAFNRWLNEEVIAREPRIKSLAYLPFNSPEACIEVVKEFADKPGVIGFTVSTTRFRPVHHNSYMPLYSLLQEVGKPLAFHAGMYWGDRSMLQIDQFIGMHAISFVHFSLVHLTNWVLNGLCERFPKLKVIWVESGLAWLPFIMQRLDSEYLMRPSEAPLLKRLPSEYIREMYFSSQPIEREHSKLVEATFEAINAEQQLMFSSDWPHWDFNPPVSISTLPFLSEQGRRNILGLNAQRLFNLPTPPGKKGIQ